MTGLYTDPETGRKTCSACNKELALSNFSPRKTSSDGFRDQCKRCRGKVSSKSRKERKERVYREGRPCKVCGTKLLRKERTGRFMFYCDCCRKLRQRCRRVGITVSQYHQMFANQKGICKLCEKRPATNIDHCYLTKKVRGLLCHGCNLLAGWAVQQGPEAVNRLERYIEVT